MKALTKILLPLSTLVATAGIATPLVSCGNKDVGEGAVDLITYKLDPSTQHTAEPLTEDEATDALFGASNAINLVEQDILGYLHGEYENEMKDVLEFFGIEGVGRPQEVVGKMSNLKLQYDANKHVATLSGIIRLKAVCEMVKQDDPTTRIGTYSVETKHEIHNLPYHMVYTYGKEKDKYYGTSYFNKTELAGNSNGYVDRYYGIVADYDKADEPSEKLSGSYQYSHGNTGSEIVDPLDVNYEALSFVRGWSYHLNNVTKG